MEYKDQYYKLQSENNELKSIHNEMEEHNRKLQSNIRKLERDYTKIAGGAAPTQNALSKDDEQLVSKLYSENSKLKAQNTAIKDKYKTLAEQFDKKKREVSMLQKKVKSSSGMSAPPLPSAGGKGTSVLQEIDVRPGSNNRSGLRTSQQHISASVDAGAGAGAGAGADSNGAENSKYMHVARNLKIKYVY